MSLELITAADPFEAAIEVFRQVAPRTLVLAGGSTPRPLYERLVRVPHPWAATDVFFSDERCVPPDYPDSNYRMAFEALLSKVAARVHRMPGETCSAATYDADIRAVFQGREVRFDLAILGLGEDGHTASLFPGDAALEVSDSLVAWVQAEDHRRLTLTLPALSMAQTVLFLVTGAGKQGAVKALMSGDDIPAARVQAARMLLITDAAAAAGL